MASQRKRSSAAHKGDIAGGHEKRFVHLKPRVRRVAKGTIRSKWTTLPETVLEKVRDMFQSLERPVIVGHRDERKRIEAQTAVDPVVRNLGRRLPRIPFPPITKESDFDYETALGEHRALEIQLTTTSNSVDLLKAEVEKEERLLANETRQLQQIEKNAKGAESERRRLMKNEHPVLRHLDSPKQPQNGMSAESTALKIQETDTGLCDLDSDPEILSLMPQLSHHLQSMQDNTAPLTGLRDAITQSQVALDLLSVPTD